MLNRRPKKNQLVDVGSLEADNLRIREENVRLGHAVEELTALNRIAQAIAASNSFQQVIDQLVRHTIDCLHAEQVVISLVEKQVGADPKTIVRHQLSGAMPEFHLTQGLLGMMLHAKGKPLLTNDPHNEQALAGLNLPDSLSSLICVPLTSEGEIIGILAACNAKNEMGFKPEDQRLLAIIASQSAQILENARLREEEATLEQVQREIGLARDIQFGLLPEAHPDIPGYDIAATTIPARSVGGDYYDFIPVENDRVALCLGDVSGKSVPASLLMANLQATMRGQAHANPGARQCVNWANQLLYRSTPIEKFATLFYCVLDPGKHTLNYTNAGHERPLLWNADATDPQPIELVAGGLMLGVLPDFAFDEDTVELAPGDVLLVYSDGVTDAINEQEEAFGPERLCRLVGGLIDRPADEILFAVTEAVSNHAGEADQLDDITLLILRRND